MALGLQQRFSNVLFQFFVVVSIRSSFCNHIKSLMVTGLNVLM